MTSRWRDISCDLFRRRASHGRTGDDVASEMLYARSQAMTGRA